MPSPRKFYKTVYTVTVLSETPIGDMPLSEVISEAINGEYSMVSDQSEAQIDGPTAARELISQHSDPEFFGLDETGNDLND